MDKSIQDNLIWRIIMAACRKTPPASHPYTAEITIEPVRFLHLEQAVEDARNLRMLDVDDSQPDLWTAWIACACDETRERMEDGWN